jgi:hypothetical protein
MAYFNHAFCKMFLGTATTDFATDSAASVAGTEDSYDVSLDAVGTYRFTDCNLTVVDVTSADVVNGKKLYLTSSSLLSNDKLGSSKHGGYKETNKSKEINPKLVSEVYKVVSRPATSQVVLLGQNSLNTAGDVPCFVCDETFDIRIDIKNSPALRFLNHNVYENISYYSGCCDGDTPENTDPILAMIGFAKYINEHPILSQFVRVGVEGTIDGGTSWTFYSDDATMLASLQPTITAGTTADGGNLDAYTSAFVIANEADYSAGLIIEAAYTDTRFEDCTFDPCDFFERQPIEIFASLVDEEGNPCPSCANLTVATLREPLQGQGYGETVLREMILSESYRQNFFHTDKRIREITQGVDILGAVDRDALFTKYYIKHNIPRYSNPSGMFDNDQYLLCIVTTGEDAGLETFLTTWLDAAGNSIDIKDFSGTV